MNSVAICIPYRDRGRDALRKENLARVLKHWDGYGEPVLITDDGRDGDAQFNRSAAYNRAVNRTDAEILVFSEADMLVPYCQISDGIDAAKAQRGLVVPFTTYRYLTPSDSDRVRRGHLSPEDAIAERVMDNGRSIGAVNIVSRETAAAIGQWDNAFEGSWWDDRAMHRAFDVAAGPTRWIPGPAHHLWHLPGWQGDHLTEEDRAATRQNKLRYQLYRAARTPEEIRALTGGV